MFYIFDSSIFFYNYLQFKVNKDEFRFTAIEKNIKIFKKKTKSHTIVEKEYVYKVNFASLRMKKKIKIYKEKQILYKL